MNLGYFLWGSSLCLVGMLVAHCCGYIDSSKLIIDGVEVLENTPLHSQSWIFVARCCFAFGGHLWIFGGLGAPRLRCIYMLICNSTHAINHPNESTYCTWDPCGCFNVALGWDLGSWCPFLLLRHLEMHVRPLLMFWCCMKLRFGATLGWFGVLMAIFALKVLYVLHGWLFFSCLWWLHVLWWNTYCFVTLLWYDAPICEPCGPSRDH